ncbi:MAG: DUF2283 domain-containing protein, partial [bacterium]
LSSGPCRIGCSLRLCVSAGDRFPLCALCSLYIISLAYVSAIRLKIDEKNDALYFRLDESIIVDSEEIKPGVILDYDANENGVGIEILGLSKRVSPHTLKSLQFETV